MDAQHIVDELQKLTPYQRRLVLAQLPVLDSKLDDRQRAIVDDYTAHFNKTKACEDAGYAPGAQGRVFGNTHVKEAVAAKLLERSAASDLNAEYVRNYMMSVLELCPTDYFFLTENGDWAIDPESFKELPREVRKLIDGVELKLVGRTRVYKVCFVSKTAVLALAARFTLVQKHDVSVSQLPWDQLVSPLQDEAVDAISARLAAERMQPRSIQAGEASVAGCDVLRQAETDCEVGVG